jgi:hypothetical protein
VLDVDQSVFDFDIKADIDRLVMIEQFHIYLASFLVNRLVE